MNRKRWERLRLLLLNLLVLTGIIVGIAIALGGGTDKETNEGAPAATSTFETKP